MPNNKKIASMIVAVLFVITFVAAIGASFYTYFYTKNYDYLIEAPCDPATTQCFFRDCEESPDDCPPNGLSYYREYYVKASDFALCSDNSCAQECASGIITCDEIICGDVDEDVCNDQGLQE